MKPNNQFDIIVAGNGLVGKIAALAFAKSGFEVAIIAPPAVHVDLRTTALMVPSIDYLKDLHIWDQLASHSAPLRSMRIIDGTNNLVRARTVTFHATEIGEDAFGWNIPNIALNAALDQKIAASASISRYDHAISAYTSNSDSISASLNDGTSVTAQLIAAADGRNSLGRDAAKINITSWSYPQTAFVTTFEHKIPHENTSTEFHTSSGPCVQVPLTGNRSSLVWVTAAERAETLSNLNDAELSLEIEKQLFSILGKVKVGPERQSFPLSGQYPDKFAQNRIALLGEAAHVFPPIGAQGLNLGIRDVEDLSSAANLSASDPGAESVLESYNRKRRPDILARVSAVDALNRSLLSSLLPAQIARTFGLALLDNAPPLRSLFMREGMRPGTGFSGLFDSLKKQLSEKRT